MPSIGSASDALVRNSTYVPPSLVWAAAHGVPVASREAGNLILRAELPDGERIDDDLDLHLPARPAAQISLPI